MVSYRKAVRDMRAAWRELLVKIPQVGVVGTCSLIARRVKRILSEVHVPQHESHSFDLEYGTDTSGIVEVGALDIPPDRLRHAVRYQSAIVDVFITLLDQLPINAADFIFIDIGSGKGRALLLASRLPFQEIIGVEISPSLHAVACQNIRTYREDTQRCSRIRSVCQDATLFDIPNKNAVIYLFNPFDGDILSVVLQNLETSLCRFPRTVYILYLKPLYRGVLDQSRYLRIVKESDRYGLWCSVGAVCPECS